jgi:hypothetical protein
MSEWVSRRRRRRNQNPEEEEKSKPPLPNNPDLAMPAYER